jgi:hypothetical protein
MRGCDLYALYVELFAAENCGVDAWEDLDAMDQRVWNRLAAMLTPKPEALR